MQSTIHLDGSTDLKIGGGPDTSVQVEIWNPMDALHPNLEATPENNQPRMMPYQPIFSRYLDRPTARLIASALLAAASSR